MDGSLIYRKTRRGAAELSITHGGHVATPSRRVLIVLDGRRTVDELTELFGAEVVEQALAELEAQGLARLSDPEGDSQTTQQVAMLDGYSYPPLHPSEAELALPDVKPRRRGGLAWIALALPALAIAGGYWIVTNANRPADAPRHAAAAQPAAPGAVAQDVLEPGEPSTGSPAEGPRELPLSGLPPVIITKASATVVAPAGAAPEAPSARHASERLAVAQVEAAPAPPPAPEAAPKTVAAADPPARQEAPQNRPRETPAAAPTVAPPAPAVATKVDTAQAERVALRAPAAEPAAPEAAAPAAPPPLQVAAAAPTLLPANEPVTLHPRKRDPPQFPGRAVRAKVDEGHVLARIWVTPEGKVEQVDIVKATPPRIFDDEVRRALSAWTFDPPGQAVNRTVELTFKP
jgi:TonB family protein